MGFKNAPPTASISRLPTMGPVQLNETKTKVKAIKKTPRKDPILLFESTEFTNWWGSVISNNPRKEAAKTINMMKNKMFGTQEVLSQLPNSGPSPNKENTKPSEE